MINYIVGLLVSFGGAMGYMKRGSIASLLGGLLIGVGYLVSGYFQNDVHSINNQRKGVYIGLVTSTLLALVGVMRYFAATKKSPTTLPILPVVFVVLGSIMGVLHVQRLFTHQHK
jgi:uncharacterized membrane protein (UPF0136 family)